MDTVAVATPQGLEALVVEFDKQLFTEQELKILGKFKGIVQTIEEKLKTKYSSCEEFETALHDRTKYSLETHKELRELLSQFEIICAAIHPRLKEHYFTKPEQYSKREILTNYTLTKKLTKKPNSP
jgi:hypothetical protein